MRKLLTVAFLILAGSAEAGDCRIKRLDMKATRKGATLIVRAYYLGYDGTVLTQALCPDQIPPTWGYSPDLMAEDWELEWPGYTFRIFNRTPGEPVYVSIATVQAPDKGFQREKIFVF